MNAVVEGIGGMARCAVGFIATVRPKTSGATVVVLSGELGAGKTTFAQGIAKALEVEETVTSPTFVLEKIYALPKQPLDAARGKKFARLVHVDAYRLKSAHELEVLGWKELLQDPGNLIVLEWPENVASAVPKDAIRITLTGSGDTREIFYGTKEN